MPVTNAASGERSQRKVPMSSFGSPKRPIGVWSMICFPRGVSSPFSSFRRKRFWSVRKNPGAMAFTRIVFEYVCARKEPEQDVARGLAEIYDYSPIENPMPPEDRRTHVLGHIRAHKRKGGIDLHFQPPREASDFCATSFQIELALSAVPQ